MAFNTHRIVSFLVLLGFGIVLAADKSPCETADIEKCTLPLADMVNFDQNKICSGIMETAETCLQTITMECAPTDEQKDTITEAMKMINISIEGCTQEPQTTKPSTESTCPDKMVQECVGKLNLADSNTNPMISNCTLLDTAMKCGDAMMVNCLNENVTAVAEKDMARVKKTMADLKCCDMTTIDACHPKKSIEMNNETVNEKDCMTLATSKDCIDKELKKCDDKIAKQQVEIIVSKVDEQMELCKSKGYKIAGGGSGSSRNTQQPAFIFFAIFLMILLRLF